MPVMQRLKRLDDAVLPNAHRWQGRYDAPYPLWWYAGPFVGALVGTVGGQLAYRTGGTVRVVGLLGVAALLLAYLVAVRRWRRRHRLPRR